MQLDNIDDGMLDTIADLVLDKLLYKMKNEIHAMTPLSVEDLIRGQMPFKESDEEFLVAELARLMTLLNLYEDREEYEKCAGVKKHLDKINKIVENL